MFIICHIYPEIGLSVREFALVCASMPTCPAASQGVVPSWPRRTWTLQTRSSRGQSRKSSCRTLWPGSVMLLQDHKLPRLWWNRAHNWWVLDRLHPFSNRLVYWYHLAKRGKQTQVLHYTTFSWWRRQTQHVAQPHNSWNIIYSRKLVPWKPLLRLLSSQTLSSCPVSESKGRILI